jgi:undecaprenyl-diphosphatase
MTWLETVILSVVEGITEFLPISSTGHMIIAGSILGISDNEFTKLFEVCIQLGAILSVVVLYWRKFFDLKRIDFYLKLIVAVFPALAFGFLFSKKIDQLLESPLTVGITMLVGGIVLLFIEKMFQNNTVDHEKDMSFKKAFVVGLWQVLAMIPGTSRSAATMIGGLQQQLSRRFAAEFSFFLAVPTMVAATGYKLLKALKEQPELLHNTDNLLKLAAGNVIAFIVAMAAIKTFIHFLQKRGLQVFGLYRIVAGIAILVLLWAGIIQH